MTATLWGEARILLRTITHLRGLSVRPLTLLKSWTTRNMDLRLLGDPRQAERSSAPARTLPDLFLTMRRVNSLNNGSIARLNNNAARGILATHLRGP